MAAVTGAVRVVLAGLVATLVLAVVRALARHVVLAVVLLALVLWYIDGLSRRGLSMPAVRGALVASKGYLLIAKLRLSSRDRAVSDAAVLCTGREALWSLRIQRSARFCAIPWQNSRVSPCGLAACKTQATRCKPRRTTDLGETSTQCFNLHRHPQTTTKQPPAARPRRRPAGARA